MRDTSDDREESGDWDLGVGASDHPVERPDKRRPMALEKHSEARRPDVRDDRPFPTRAGVLTKAEIEALLRPNLPDDIGRTQQPRSIERRLPVQFDDGGHDAKQHAMREASGQLAARLSLGLGRHVGLKAAVALRDVQPVATTLLAGLMTGKAGAVACFGPSETDTRLLVCLPGMLADAVIAQACGARGSTGRIGDGWTLSAIDCALLEQLLAPLAAALGDGLRLQAIETDVPYVTSLLPQGTVSIAEFGVEAPGLRSEMAVIARLPDASATADPVGSPVSVMAVVTARIASLSVPMSHLTSLKAGSTLLLGLPGDQPVEILSGDRSGPVAFEGEVGRKGNHVAVRITRKVRGLLG